MGLSIPSSFEKTNHWMSCCDSESCILAQEEEYYLQTGDPQLTRHALLILLLIISLSANLYSCAGSSTLRLDVELQFCHAASDFGQRFISFGSFGLDKHLQPLRDPTWHAERAGRRCQRHCPMCGHCSVQVWAGGMGEKEKSLSTMKSSSAGDTKVERHDLTGVACEAT